MTMIIDWSFDNALHLLIFDVLEAVSEDKENLEANKRPLPSDSSEEDIDSKKLRTESVDSVDSRGKYSSLNFLLY